MDDREEGSSSEESSLDITGETDDMGWKEEKYIMRTQAEEAHHIHRQEDSTDLQDQW